MSSLQKILYYLTPYQIYYGIYYFLFGIRRIKHSKIVKTPEFATKCGYELDPLSRRRKSFLYAPVKPRKWFYWTRKFAFRIGDGPLFLLPRLTPWEYKNGWTKFDLNSTFVEKLHDEERENIRFITWTTRRKRFQEVKDQTQIVIGLKNIIDFFIESPCVLNDELELLNLLILYTKKKDKKNQPDQILEIENKISKIKNFAKTIYDFDPYGLLGFMDVELSPATPQIENHICLWQKDNRPIAFFPFEDKLLIFYYFNHNTGI